MERSKPGFELAGREVGPNIHFRLLRQYLNIARGCPDVTDQDEQLVRELDQLGTPAASNIAGSISLDIAARPKLSPYGQTEWAATAQYFWQRSIETADDSLADRVTALNAETNLLYLPDYFELIHYRNLPSRTAQQITYEGLSDIANRTLDVQREAKAKHLEAGKDAIGQLAKLSVLLLHQRFVLRELDENSQMALPSLISQARDDGSKRKNAWDVSIYTKNRSDDIPNISYRVKVRSRKEDKSGRNAYRDDIVQVNVFHDLVVTQDERVYGGIKVAAVPKDCDAELNLTPYPILTDRLDQRTAKLLDILG